MLIIIIIIIIIMTGSAKCSHMVGHGELSSRTPRSFMAVDSCTVALGKVRTCAVTLFSC